MGLKIKSGEKKSGGKKNIQKVEKNSYQLSVISYQLLVIRYQLHLLLLLLLLLLLTKNNCKKTAYKQSTWKFLKAKKKNHKKNVGVKKIG